MKTGPTVKPDSLRDDLRYRPEAISRGWKPEAGRVAGDPLSFVKGDKHLWMIRNGWRCADLTGDGSALSIRYHNHRTHPDLSTALRKES
jgi:hypothetical protein